MMKIVLDFFIIVLPHRHLQSTTEKKNGMFENRSIETRRIVSRKEKIENRKRTKRRVEKENKKIRSRGPRDYAFRFENSTTKGRLKNIYIYFYIYVYVIYMNVYKYRYRYSITESFFLVF